MATSISRRVKCKICKKVLPTGSGGRPAAYCSAACRQKAYRRRIAPLPIISAARRDLRHECARMDGEQKLRTAAVKVLEKLGYVVNLKRGESVTAKRKRHAATGDLGGAMQSFRAMASAIPLPPMIEARRQRVLAMLAENPGTRLALVTDTQAEPESVIVTVGVRDKGTLTIAQKP